MNYIFLYKNRYLKTLNFFFSKEEKKGKEKNGKLKVPCRKWLPHRTSDVAHDD